MSGLILPARGPLPEPVAPWQPHCFPSLLLFSHKFGKKVTYFNYLSELREHVKCDQLAIPPEVVR